MSSIIEVVSVGSALASLLGAMLANNYLSLRKLRKTVEKSFLLRSRIKVDYAIKLRKLGRHEKVLRWIIISRSDVEKTDNVQRAYELLLEKDLSKERCEIEAVQVKDRHDHVLDHYVELITAKRKSRTWQVLNAGLLRAAVGSKLSSIRPADEASSSILGLMLGKRMQIYSTAYGYLLAALGIGTLFYLTSRLESASLLGVILPLILIFCMALNQKVLEYRVNKGYFGNNASEASEFIQFVTTHSDKSDFTDGDKMRKLMPDVEAESEKEVLVYGGEAAA